MSNLLRLTYIMDTLIKAYYLLVIAFIWFSQTGFDLGEIRIT